MSVILARHGQTKFNEEKRFQGVSDSPLTPHGISQARQLGDFLGNYQTKKFLLSPLPRVFETYRICTSDQGAPYEIRSELEELCYGEWEAQYKADLDANVLMERKKDRFNFVHPGSYMGVRGGSYKVLYQRLLPFWSEISDCALEKNSPHLVVISHLGIMRCCFKYFKNLSDIETGKLEIPNNLVVVLSVHNGKLVFNSKSL